MIVWISPATAFWDAASALRSGRGVRERWIRTLDELAMRPDRVGSRARSLLRALPPPRFLQRQASAPAALDSAILHHRHKDLLIEAIVAPGEDGRWGASVTVFAGDASRTCRCWVPSIGRYYKSREDAEAAALAIGLDHAERHGTAPKS